MGLTRAQYEFIMTYLRDKCDVNMCIAFHNRDNEYRIYVNIPKRGYKGLFIYSSQTKQENSFLNIWRRLGYLVETSDSLTIILNTIKHYFK